MSFVLLFIAVLAFLIGAACDFGWFGASSEHVLGIALIGLAAFAGAHFAWPPYFRR